MTSVANAHQQAMESAAFPAFSEELESVWGKRWGAHDEVGRLRHVLMRRPGQELGVINADAWDEGAQALVDPAGRWYWTDRTPPDLERVWSQHDGLVQTLRNEGVEVTVAEPLGGSFTKAVYMRDPLVTTPNGAIIARMGVRMRRGEEPDVTRTIADLGMPIIGTITGTGTLEGGSYIKLRPDLHVFGTSLRCNQEGARQLAALLATMGVQLHVTPVPGWSIHMDLHLAMVDQNRALVDTDRLSFDFLDFLVAQGIELIEADPSDAWAVNLLCLEPGRVLMAETSARTAEILAREGIDVITVPYGELQKNGGGIHCSTMELVRDAAS